MPEGDTIWRAAAALQRRAGGLRVTSARPAALARLTGRTLLQVESVGKHLYMRFSDGLVLHTHMRMTGAWHLYGADEPRRRAAHRMTAAIDFGSVEAVLYAAPVCELILATAVGAGLGPDILSADFDARNVVIRVRGCARATIAEVLLDQQVCAGVGNIHRCEALWHERIDPMTPPSHLGDGVLERIYERARDRMRRSAVADAFRPGTSVHGRAGRPCPECGTLIQAAALGQPSRIVFWCPRCQGRAQAADRDGEAMARRSTRAAAPSG